MFKKYSITVLFSLLLIFTAFTGGGFAETAEQPMSPETAEALADVYEVNAEIYKEIAKVQVKAEKMYADYLAEVAKTEDASKQAEAWEKYDLKVDSMIADLKLKTEAMTLKGMEKAEEAGLTVEMEWVTVRFADREADIDPIKVIDW
ncbi:hypothetical protein BB776_01705 [Planococcus salinarum]|uniref:DUF3347 domain-containing protein n=1 Tax=Planococcus salinarum TaxID=622695 RepID=A0ABX3D133_9BACL|nr:hypothetical protein [Planococcus salinarum]OHX53652.1 hypothetical protein BB776_01705 [Planococcus salinarum]TAA73485.1 hypothetical protein D2909_01165 [Planococcus salinarum]